MVFKDFYYQKAQLVKLTSIKINVIKFKLLFLFYY